MSERIFAVIPAAGHSRRMGRPKLLLPLGSQSVIAHLLQTLSQKKIYETVVVVRPDDDALQAEVRTHPARLILPETPPEEMRNSIEFALSFLQNHLQPKPSDGWLLIPADHPYVSPDVLSKLFARWKETTADVLVPTFAERRGHPTLFRWSLVERLTEIPADQGLNWLLRGNADIDVEELPLEEPSILWDMDTPEDYEQITRAWKNLQTVSENGRSIQGNPNCDC